METNNKKPFFSIITPVYNGSTYIHQTIKSVLEQNFTQFEWIIINDGSTDDTLKELHKISDKRVIILSKSNGGVSSARNLGLSIASGQYIAFLDSDDYWYPNHLQEAFQFFTENPKIPIFTALCIHSSSIPNTQKKIYTNFTIQNYFSYGYKFCNSTTFFVKAKLLGDKKFDEKMRIGEDYTFWYKLALQSPDIGIGKLITAIYIRRNNSAMTTTSIETTNLFISVLRMLSQSSATIKHNRALQEPIYSSYVQLIQQANLKNLCKNVWEDRKILHLPFTFIFLIMLIPMYLISVLGMKILAILNKFYK